MENETNIDLRPLKVGDTAWFKPEYTDEFGIEPCTIRKVTTRTHDGITTFLYYIRDKYQRYMYTYELDPSVDEVSYSPYFIFSTQEKCMDYCVAKFKKKIQSDLESFKKNSLKIGYDKQLQLTE
jgi:hypothetical protein